MDTIEESLSEILEGKGVSDESGEMVDLTLAEQLEELASKGIESNAESDYQPVVKKSVSYIVAAVLVNESNEILMMQEAKSTCAGTWYLPAGRIEPGENIIEAVKREVVEETGLEFEPTTLLMVETAQGQWYRFVFTGKVTGGQLKTVANADSESLQASWISDLSQLSLRANDIVPLIDKARSFAERSAREPWHDNLMPADQPHKRLLLRLVIIIRKKSNNRIHVLVSEKESAHLPTCEILPTRNFHSTIKKYMQHVFGEQVPPHKPQGVLSIEYSPSVSEDSSQRHDGICLTLLVPCRAALEDIHPGENYTWLEVNQTLGNQLLSRMAKNMLVSLHVVR